VTNREKGFRKRENQGQKETADEAEKRGKYFLFLYIS
jgi:hypothetical protein